MKRAREAYPDKYAAAVARKRARRNPQTVQAIVKNELRKTVDWKYTDYSVTSNAIYDIAAPISLLSNLVRGDTGFNNFNGNTIRPQAITIKYFAETVQPPYEALRFMVFQWFDSTAPATAGVLATSANTTALVAPTLVTNKPYIKVLYDKLHLLSPNTAAANVSSGFAQPTTIYIPGKKLKDVRFASAANTVQDGDLYVLALSNDAALGTVNLTMYSRVTFSDV